MHLKPINHFNDFHLISSNAANEKPSIYFYNSGDDQEVRHYFPVNPSLQEIAKNLQTATEGKRPWETYINEGRKHLQERTENDFTRPAANTDKLYMNIGNGEVIEVQHPQPTDSADENSLALNRLHLGPIGSGKDIVRSDSARIEFARAHGLLATDVEMSSVLDSIIGNCRESFILVKGLC